MEQLEFVRLDLASIGSPQSGAQTHDQVTGVLLHGFGASANDLIGLAPGLGVARHWLFPHAPAALVVYGMQYGRAWFPRDAATMERAVAGEFFTRRRALQPPGLTQSARELHAALTQQVPDLGGLILGGFSQGAMVTAEYLRLALVEGWPLPRAALLFSGSLIAEAWWDRLDRSDPRAAGCPIFQTHGRSDTVLPYEDAEALAEVLRRAGFDVTWLATDEGHTIPERAIAAAAQVLQRTFA